jgi:uncharacterized protein (TIGR02246 family)
MRHAMARKAQQPTRRTLACGVAKQSVGRDAIRAYFDAGKALKARVVEFGEHACRMIDSAAVCSGHYTFERTPTDGEPKKAPARFSIVLAKQDGRWLIVDHHSSL